jgi:membrane protein implicated in regulation of membrane protease activity
MNEALPVGSPLSGALWTWVVPALLFAVAAVATWLLYRHFANRKSND